MRITHDESSHRNGNVLDEPYLGLDQDLSSFHRRNDCEGLINKLVEKDERGGLKKRGYQVKDFFLENEFAVVNL